MTNVDFDTPTEVIPPRAGDRVLNRADMQKPGALQAFRERGAVSGSDVMISNTRGGLRFENMMQVMEFAKMMSLADIGVPKHLRGNPGACLRIALQADAWGFDPFSVADKSYDVGGRISYESQLVHAVIERRAPLERRLRMEYRGEGPTRRCKVIGHVIGEDKPFEWEGPEFQAIKVKNSPEWTANTDKQLWYHASRDWARIYFPDVLLGVYTRDELENTELGPDRARDVRSIADRLPENREGGYDEQGIAKTLREAGANLPEKAATPEPAKEEPISEPAKPAEEPSEKPPVDEPVAATATETPETALEYALYADQWIGAATDKATADKRWESERELRAKCKMPVKERKRLEKKLEAKFTNG